MVYPKKFYFVKKSYFKSDSNSTQEFRHTLKSKKKTTFIDKKVFLILGNILDLRRRLIGKKEKKNF